MKLKLGSCEGQIGIISVKYRDCRYAAFVSAEFGQGITGFLHEFKNQEGNCRNSERHK